MMGSVDEIQLFQVLIKSMGAKKCLEIGCFTGYTTLCLAEAMPDDGFIFTCDITDEAVAKEIWKEAGVANKVYFCRILDLNSFRKKVFNLKDKIGNR